MPQLLSLKTVFLVLVLSLLFIYMVLVGGNLLPLFPLGFIQCCSGLCCKHEVEWLCVDIDFDFYFSGLAPSSFTPLLLYWPQSKTSRQKPQTKTSRQSWERYLAKGARNTMCSLWAIVCLTTSAGFWLPALTSMGSCQKPAL